MGIIVGRKIYVECDEVGCSNCSNGSYIQENVRIDAEKEGWYISSHTGKAKCPKCRGR